MSTGEINSESTIVVKPVSLTYGQILLIYNAIQQEWESVQLCLFHRFEGGGRRVDSLYFA